MNKKFDLSNQLLCIYRPFQSNEMNNKNFNTLKKELEMLSLHIDVSCDEVKDDSGNLDYEQISILVPLNLDGRDIKKSMEFMHNFKKIEYWEIFPS